MRQHAWRCGRLMRMPGSVAQHASELCATDTRASLHMHAAGCVRGHSARSATAPQPQLPWTQNGEFRAWPSFAACSYPGLAALRVFCPHGCQQRRLQTLQPAAVAASATAPAAGAQQMASAASDAAALQQGGLVVVESPAKARKIQQYLGSGFTVRSSAEIHHPHPDRQRTLTCRWHIIQLPSV